MSATATHGIGPIKGACGSADSATPSNTATVATAHTAIAGAAPCRTSSQRVSVSCTSTWRMLVDRSRLAAKRVRATASWKVAPE